jgi:hypothetical protein
MLHLRRRRPTPLPATNGSLLDRPDLRIRNLLDDPALRRAMGLDAPETERPQHRFDRRRLLIRNAA